jgi:hypothetical protein
VTLVGGNVVVVANLGVSHEENEEKTGRPQKAKKEISAIELRIERRTVYILALS